MLGSFSRLRQVGGMMQDPGSGRVLVYSGNRPDQEQKLASIAAGADDSIPDLEHGIALAMWDEGERLLTLATDRCGNSNLFYHHDGRRLVFASEAKSILALLGRSATLNRTVLAEIVWFGHSVTDRTLFQDILKLRPGTILRFSAAGLEFRKYWSLRFVPAREQEWPELVDAAEQALAGSVVRATAGPGTAVAVTGGVDTRAILAEVVGQGIRADGFTAGARDSTDMKIGSRLSRHLSGRHHRLFLDRSFARLFPEHARRFVWLTEGQLDIESSYLVHLSERCRERFRVLVDGGGAEVCKRAFMRRPSRQVESVRDLPGLIANRYGRPGLTRLLFGPADFKAVEETIVATLRRLLSEVEQETVGDTLDAYFLGVNWPNFYAQAVSLQAGFLLGQLPFLEPEFLDVVSKLPLAVRERSRVHFRAIERRAPLLRRYPRAFQGLAIPFTETPLVKYALPAADLIRTRLGIRTRRRPSFPVREWLESESIPELVETPARFSRRAVLDPQVVARTESDQVPADLRFSAKLLLWRLELWHELFADSPDPFQSA